MFLKDNEFCSRFVQQLRLITRFFSLRRFDVGPDADQPPDDKLPDGAAGSQSSDISQQSSQFRSHPHTRLAL